MFLDRRKKVCYYSTFAVFDKPSRRRKKINWRFFLRGGFFILLFGGGFYLLFVAPTFQIKKIEISGQNILTAEQIKSAVRNELNQIFLKFIPGDRLLAINGQKLAEKIKDNFSEIAEAEIKKTLPDKLEIKIIERQATAIWCRAESNPQIETATSTEAVAENSKSAFFSANGDCFFIDAEGVIYRSAPQLSGTLMPIFFSPAGVNLKERAIASSTVSFALAAKKALRDDSVDLTGFFVKNSETTEIIALTGGDWLIYFDVNQSVDKQVKILTAFLAEYSINKKNPQYVDLRIEGRIYYK